MVPTGGHKNDSSHYNLDIPYKSDGNYCRHLTYMAYLNRPKLYDYWPEISLLSSESRHQSLYTQLLYLQDPDNNCRADNSIPLGTITCTVLWISTLVNRTPAPRSFVYVSTYSCSLSISAMSWYLDGGWYCGWEMNLFTLCRCHSSSGSERFRMPTATYFTGPLINKNNYTSCTMLINIYGSSCWNYYARAAVLTEKVWRRSARRWVRSARWWRSRRTASLRSPY